MIADLNRGMAKAGYDGYYVSEFSPFSNPKPRPISRENLIQIFEARLKNYNIWETVRTDRSRLTDNGESWLN